MICLWFMVYGDGDIHNNGYIDSDFQSDVNNPKSTSDFVFLLNSGVMRCKSSK